MLLFFCRRQWLAVPLATVLTLPGVLCAQPDPEAPVYIHADDAELNEKTGVSVYRGNVSIEQDALLLQASVITVYSSGEGIDRIVATGDPVRYREKTDRGPPLIATAGKFEYSLVEEHAVLSGRARIEQEGNLLSGERIFYDVAAESGWMTGQPPQRVETVLQPGSSLLKNKLDEGN